jgi:uncharacterized protein
MPGVFHQPLTASAAADFLADLTSHPAHQYLRDLLAPTLIAWPAHTGYKQTTDVFLLALAAHSNAILLTLDLRLQRAFPKLAMETVAF